MTLCIGTSSYDYICSKNIPLDTGPIQGEYEEYPNVDEQSLDMQDQLDGQGLIQYIPLFPNVLVCIYIPSEPSTCRELSVCHKIR